MGVQYFEGLLNPNVANNNDAESIDISIDETDREVENHIFSSEITDNEVRLAIKNLKQGKDPGPDNVIPEFFIYGIESITHFW